MTHQSYLKVWILVLLGLGVIRLLTLSPESPVTNPQAGREPILNTQTNRNLTKPTLPATSSKKMQADPSPKNDRVMNSSVLPSTNLRRSATLDVVPKPDAARPKYSDTPAEESVEPTRSSQPSPEATEPNVRTNRGSSGNSTVARVPATFFTVGSTKDDVLAVQGTPTELGERVWKYGVSSVHFQGARVVSWDVFPGQPLRVKLIPSSSPTTTLAYFTVGSTKDDVLAVQGTPTQLGEYVWKYGLSSVHFQGARVVSWNVFPGQPLRVRSSR